MYTYESKLDKGKFFSEIKRIKLDGVLSLGEGGGEDHTETPTGFIIGGIWLAIFIGPGDSIWVGLGKTKGRRGQKEALIDKLQLVPADTYPYTLKNPTNEVMAIWKNRRKEKKGKG